MNLSALSSKQVFLFLCVLFFDGVIVVFAQENDFRLPVVKIPSRVQSVDWNADASLFSYTESNSVTVRDGSSHEKIHNITIDGSKIAQLKFATSFEGALEQIIMVSENSDLSIFSLPSTKPFLVNELDAAMAPPIAAFSKDGNFLALSSDDGDIDLYFQLYLTQNITSSLLRNPLDDAEKIKAATLSFSGDSKYLAALQPNGKAVIFDVAKRKPLSVLSDVDFEIPCIAIGENQTLFVASDKRTIQTFDFDGNKLLEFKTEEDIASFTLSANRRDLIVVTKDNLFNFYAVDTGVQEGFIPAWNKTEISCYSFTENEQRLLVGHDDGSIYILDVEKVFILKGQNAGVYNMYNVDSGEQWQYDADKMARLGGQGQQEKTGEPNVRFRNAHSIELRGDCSFLNGCYKVCPSVEIGYTNASLLKPVYFGGLLKASLAFPTDDFPYEYWDNGETISNPKLASFAILVPFGVGVMPFSKDVEIFAEASVGMVLYTLQQSDKSFWGKYFSPCAGLTAGMSFNRFSIFFGVNYDTVTEFSFRLGAGYRIKVGKK